MRTLILQFEEDDSPEHLGELLTRRGVDWNVIRLDRPHPPISLAGYDALFALGGAMNADEIDAYPFLDEAKSLIGRALTDDLPFLGICLGSQLLARALDAPVRRADVPEIGLIPVQVRSTDDPLLQGLNGTIPTVQFHVDTFHLPPGAELLASSADCAHQIVRCGRRAYGVQFHPEVSWQTFGRWVDDAYAASSGNHDPVAARRVVEEVRRNDPMVRRYADRLLGNFVDVAQESLVSL